MTRGAPSVAILGDGPAAATLAALLARGGARVALFSAGRRPELLVGESLVPAIVPFLRLLGVEDEVKSYAVHKPGATFVLHDGKSLHFNFGDVEGRLPRYAYNVPRDRFDRTLLAAAERAGAHVLSGRGQVERVPGTERLRLGAESLAAASAVLGGAPDWLVDASGRARTFAKLLDLATEEGDRHDTALFAHLDRVPLYDAGHVHTDRLQHGWAWRIPLPGRVSLGVVVDPTVLRRFGETAEAQYDGYLASEPHLRALTAGAKRLTPVMRYTNYQLVTERGVGEGWALLGDAFGFVDPVFSSGLYIAMDGAAELAKALLSGRPEALARYERHVREHIDAWRRIVSYYYDGRLFTLFVVGEEFAGRAVGKLINLHAFRHLPRIFTGEATTRTYSRRLLDVMIKYALRGEDPTQLQIH